MDRIGSYLVYGSEGVCLLEDVRRMAFDRTGEAEYYVLSPVNRREAKIFVPVSCQALVDKMRPLITKEEIDRTIDAAANKKFVWIHDRKRRASVFRAVRNEMKTSQSLMMLCCLYIKKQELEDKGKRMVFTDLEILSTTETLVGREIACALDIPYSEVGNYIRARLGLKPAVQEAPVG